MENLTMSDLIRGMFINIKPLVSENITYFHAEIINSPYFMMCQYNDTVDYDEETILNVSSYNYIGKELADEFKKFFNSLLPKFSSWDDTNIYYETINFDSKGILRINFDLTWCEISK